MVIEGLELSVPAYSSDGDNHICLIVEAWDINGNKTRQVHFSSVYQDTIPAMTAIGDNTDIIKGAAAELSVVTEDDWASAEEPVRSFVCATSLEGLEEGAGRNALGRVEGRGEQAHPVIRLAYPEAEGHFGGVYFNEAPYVDVLKDSGKVWLDRKSVV